MSIRKALAQRAPMIAECYRTYKGIKRSAKRFVQDRNIRTDFEYVSLAGFRNTFFGYYDKSPFYHKDEDLILVHANNACPWKKPNPREETFVYLVDWRRGAPIEELGSTYSWNWQQGARVHWFYDNYYIFNKYDELGGRYKACIGRVGTKEKLFIPYPVQDSHPSGLIFSISYGALSVVRPDYGYFNIPFDESDLLDCSLTMYDFRTGGTCDLVFISDLVDIASERHGAFIRRPKINHVLASPDGKGVVFLFRYFAGNRRITDLLYCDLDSKSVSLLLSDGGVSHYCWKDSRTLLFSGVVNEKFGYHLMDIQTGIIPEFFFDSPDGHPSMLTSDIVVTDTYPDEYGYRSLYAFNISSKEQINLFGKFVEPALFHGVSRCDLHPSASPSGELVQVDALRQRSRCICVVNAREYV